MADRATFKLNKEKIIAAFYKMDYGEAIASTKLAEEWLERRNINWKALKIENIVSEATSTTSSNGFNDIFRKHAFFNEIIDELRQHIQLLVQLEMLVRGFSHKDAMKSINLFLDYLSFYSTYPTNESRSVYYPNYIPLSYMGFIMGKYRFGMYYCAPKLYIIMLAIKDIIKEIGEKYDAQFMVSIGNEAAMKNSPEIHAFAGRTPVLVFPGADLDSACESIVNAAFGEQGMMPWSVNTVLVQESILREVVAKLKHRLQRVKIGRSVDRQVDFSVPHLLGDYTTLFNETLSAAEAKGLEVFQPEGSTLTALFVGGRVYNNNVLSVNKLRVPFVNVLAFRNIREGVALSNNQQQTFAASVWANNVGLVHEIAHGLNVNTVWVNTHGVFHPSAPFPFDFAGVHARNHSAISDLIAHSKAAQVSWAKKSGEQRVQMLQGIAVRFENKCPPDDPARQMAEQMLKIGSRKTGTIVEVHDMYELKQINSQPRTVVINHAGDFHSHFEHSLGALIIGNAVIMNVKPKLTVNSSYHALFEDMTIALPGIFQTCSCDFLLEYSEMDYCQYKHIWTAVGESYL